MTKQLNFPETIPLVQDSRGVIRVTGSRVTLDTIIGRMQVGDTPEEIHEGFPTVKLEQINTIIDWYLNNKSKRTTIYRSKKRKPKGSVRK